MNKVEFILLDLVDMNGNLILEETADSYTEADQFLKSVNSQYDYGMVNFVIMFENDINYQGTINAKEEDNLGLHVMDFAFSTLQRVRDKKVRAYYETIVNECQLL